jgi:hypothetical protein
MGTRDGAQVAEVPALQWRTAETSADPSAPRNDDRVSKKSECLELIRIALPIVVTMICQQGMVVTDQVSSFTYRTKANFRIIPLCPL